MPNDKDKDASSPSSLRCLVPSDHSWGQNPVWAFERYASGNLDRFGRPFFRIGKSSMHLFASFNMFQHVSTAVGLGTALSKSTSGPLWAAKHLHH